MTTMSADLQSLVMAVGEIRGQMRELVHATNNNAQAINGMAVSVAKLETIPADIIEFKAQLAAHEARLAALEAAEHKRKGAVSFWAWFIQSPVPGGIVSVVTFVWVFFVKGKTGQ